MRQRLSALVTGVFMLASVSAAAAPSIRLVSGPDYFPFSDPSLPSGGLTGALVQAAFAATDTPVEPVQFEPWKRGYADALAGVFDATYPYIRSAPRESEMLYSDAIYDIVSVALFRADSGRDYAAPDNLRGLTLCLPIGYAPAPPLVSLIDAGAIEVQRPSTSDLCLRELAEGRVDVFVSSTDLIEQRVAALFGPSAPFARGHVPVVRQSLYLIAPRAGASSVELIHRFNEGLARIRRSGRYDEIVQRQRDAS